MIFLTILWFHSLLVLRHTLGSNGVSRGHHPPNGGWKPQDCISNPKLENMPFCKCISKCKIGDRTCQVLPSYTSEASDIFFPSSIWFNLYQVGCNHNTVRAKSPSPNNEMKPQDCINKTKMQTLPYCRCIATCTFGNRACQVVLLLQPIACSFWSSNLARLVAESRLQERKT